MSDYMVTQQISLDKLHDLQLKITGDKICAKQSIIINGIKISAGAGDENKGDGIGAIELILDPTEKPKLSITYHKRIIRKEVAECLGLEKVYS